MPIRTLAACVLAACIAAPPALGQSRPQQGVFDRMDHGKAVGTIVNTDYWKNFYRIPLDVVTAPFDWTGREWGTAAVAVAGVGLLFFLDEPIQDGMQDGRNNFTDTLADIGRPFGDTKVVLGVTGGGYLLGSALGSERLAGTSLVGLQSFLIAAGITEGLKRATRRNRPNSSDDAFDFNGPGGDGDKSFVSGHATHAFALATVFASEFHDVAFIPPLAYGLATLTAFSRVNDNDHWATDVILGAAIGYGIGRVAYRLSPFKRGNDNVAILPYTDGDTTGVKIRMRF